MTPSPTGDEHAGFAPLFDLIATAESEQNADAKVVATSSLLF